jgi:hypothetical protein
MIHTASGRLTDIPMQFKIRGGKTVMVLPDGSRLIEQRAAIVDNAMVKMIARAFRWQRLLSDGTYTTLEDLAAAEHIDSSYVSRVLRLTCLSPRIIEAILDGKHPAKVTMKNLMAPLPVAWEEQEQQFLARRTG